MYRPMRCPQATTNWPSRVSPTVKPRIFPYSQEIKRRECSSAANRPNANGNGAFDEMFCPPSEDTGGRSLCLGGFAPVEGELRSHEYQREVVAGPEKTAIPQRVWEIRVDSVLKLD